MTEMNREFCRDLVVGQFVQQFEEANLVAGIDADGPTPLAGTWPALAGIAAIGVGRAAPDMLEALVAGHRSNRLALVIDDRHPHLLDRRPIRKITITMEMPDAAIDPEREED